MLKVYLERGWRQLEKENGWIPLHKYPEEMTFEHGELGMLNGVRYFNAITTGRGSGRAG